MVDWKKVGKKVLKSACIVVLTGFVAVYAENPYILGIIPVIVGVLDTIKHWNV